MGDIGTEEDHWLLKDGRADWEEERVGKFAAISVRNSQTALGLLTLTAPEIGGRGQIAVRKSPSLWILA